MPRDYSNVPFHGLFVAMATPLDDSGALDPESIAGLAKHLTARRGVTGLTVNARIGEGPVLSRTEQVEVIRTVRAAVGDDSPLISSVSASSSDEILARTEEAAAAGADAVMVFPPLFLAWGKVPSRVRVGFYEDLAARASIPLVLFQIPVESYWLTPDEVAQVAQIDGVVAMKEASFDLHLYWETLQALGETPALEVLNGNDRFIAEAALLGSTGDLIGIANVLPEAWAHLHEIGATGSAKDALALQRRLRGVQDAIFRDPILDAPARIKAVLKREGIIASDVVRRPQLGISAQEKDAVWAAIEDARRDLAHILEP